MKIHEYQGKEILRQFGIPVPQGFPAFTVQEALEAALKIGGTQWVIKAQIHTVGDSQDFTVKIANSLDELKQVAGALLNMQLVKPEMGGRSQKVRRLLVEEVVPMQKAYDVSFVPDRQSQKIAVRILSHDGSIQKMSVLDCYEVEPVCFIDPLVGITDTEVCQLLHHFDFPFAVWSQGQKILKCLYQVCVQTDVIRLQLSPLMLSTEDRILVSGVDIVFDDAALFRQAEIFALRDLDEEIPQAIDALAYGLTYEERDGCIGCLTNGQGLAQTIEDLLLLAGKAAACFVNVGSKITKEKICAALEIILKNQKVDSVLINIFEGFLDCRDVALGIIEVVKSMGLSIPLVVRLEGAYKLEGRELLRNANLSIFCVDDLVSGVHYAAQVRP